MIAFFTLIFTRVADYDGEKDMREITLFTCPFIMGGALTALVMFLLYKLRIREKDSKENEHFTMKMRSLADVAPVGVFRMDSKMDLMFANTKCLNLLGFKTSEEMNESFFEIISEKNRNEIRQFMKNTGINTGSFDRDFDLINGEKRLTLFFTSFLWEGNTQFIGILTESKLKTESCEKTTEKSCTKKEDRNPLILKEVSDEIRIQMEEIVTQLGFLKKTNLSTEKKHVSAILTSVDYVQMQLNNMLDYAKESTGDMNIEKIDFNIRTAASDTVQSLLPMMLSKNIEFSLNTGDNIPGYVNGDPTRLRQVIMNIIRVAIKSMDTGKILFEIKKNKTGNKNNHHLEFSMKLIPETSLNFKELPFDSKKSLAFSVSEKILEAMDGHIYTKNENKKFFLCFSAVFHKAEDKLKWSSYDNVPLKGHSVLIVSSGLENSDRLKENLIEWGIHPDITKNADSAIKMFEEKRLNGEKKWDAVIVLAGLKKETALSFARRIKKSDFVKEGLKLILLSSMSIKGEAAQLESAGYDVYLSQPFDNKHLKSALKILFKKTSPETEQKKKKIITRFRIDEALENDTKILVVDDTPLNRTVTARMVEKSGLKSEVASNGKEAVEKAMKRSFGLILMDCRMPVMDGLEASREIRRMEEYDRKKRTPIVALTANFGHEQKQLCLSAGMDGFLEKPISMAHLKNTLKTYVDGTVISSAKKYETESDKKIEIVDTERLNRTAEHDVEYKKELVSIFLKDSKRHIKAIASMINNPSEKDIEDIEIHAHAIKGDSANMGAKKLKELSERLEKMASKNIKDGLDEGLNQIEEELSKVERFLKDFIDNPESGKQP
ncbi:MAG: response regulator [bacterium]